MGLRAGSLLLLSLAIKTFQMKKILLFFLCVSFCLPLIAQTTIGNQNVDQFSRDASGDKEYGLTWLPTSYSSNPSKRYPVIIFLHGSGQEGTGLTALNGLTAYGLPDKIAGGFQPSAVNPKDGQTYEFIVCSPMAPNWSADYNTLKYILPDIVSRYRVDTTHIYLTGFSAGGGTAFDGIASNDSNFILFLPRTRAIGIQSRWVFFCPSYSGWPDPLPGPSENGNACRWFPDEPILAGDRGLSQEKEQQQ